MSIFFSVFLRVVTCQTPEWKPCPGGQTICVIDSGINAIRHLPCTPSSSVEVKFYTNRAKAEKALGEGARVWHIDWWFGGVKRIKMEGQYSCLVGSDTLKTSELHREAQPQKFVVTETEIKL